MFIECEPHAAFPIFVPFWRPSVTNIRKFFERYWALALERCSVLELRQRYIGAYDNKDGLCVKLIARGGSALALPSFNK